MVIQEAFVLGRPLMVSNIGGMAEKVRDGLDGLHVAAGNRLDWSAKLLKACEPELWAHCASHIRRPLSYAECAEAHLPLLA